jgi:hypothetical protein
LELASWSVLDQPDRFDAKNSRELNTRRKTLAREKFRAVETERLHADEDLPWSRCGNRAILNLKNFRAAGFMDHHSFHGCHRLSFAERREGCG